MKITPQDPKYKYNIGDIILSPHVGYGKKKIIGREYYPQGNREYYPQGNEPLILYAVDAINGDDNTVKDRRIWVEESIITLGSNTPMTVSNIMVFAHDGPKLRFYIHKASPENNKLNY